MYKPIQVTVGERIAEVRRARGLTQSGLAALIATSSKEVRRYEKGQTKIPTPRLNEIAQWLQCDTARLHDAPGSPLPRRRKRIHPVTNSDAELIKLYAIINPPGNGNGTDQAPAVPVDLRRHRQRNR